VQFLVGNLEQDRQVQRVTNVALFWPLRGIHCGHALGKSTPKRVPQTGNGSATSPEPKTDVGTVICYGIPRLALGA
jgi:hypothetical protein